MPIPSDIWAAFIIFNRLATQWRVTTVAWPDGSLRFVYFGLDYAAVVAMMQTTMKFKDRPALMDDLRIMEAAALPVLNGAAHAEVQP